MQYQSDIFDCITQKNIFNSLTVYKPYFMMLISKVQFFAPLHSKMKSNPPAQHNVKKGGYKKGIKAIGQEV